ncbi:hypothetical protein QZH41_003800 [Actinostola sp. cb2023]|nr:hypothetical protein QZH41_003800 [Actinostola sp. cb2023]
MADSPQGGTFDHEEAEEANSSPNLEEIHKILMNIQASTNQLLQDNKVLTKGYEELKSSMEYHSSVVDELTKANGKLLQEVKCLESSLSQANTNIDELKVEKDKLRADLEVLEQKQDEMEQYQRKYNVEIHGIPESPDEEVDQLIVKLAESINVDIDYDDLDIAHRIPSRAKIRPIIVKFKAYEDKSNFYAARSKLKYLKVNDHDFNGASSIYINENLTSHRKSLYADVRKRAKQNRWFASWTSDGKILVRKEKGGKIYRIRKEADLEFLY